MGNRIENTTSRYNSYNMKKCLIFLSLLASCQPKPVDHAPGQQGLYAGTFEFGNFAMDFDVKLKKDSLDWIASFTCLEQNAYQIPFRVVKVAEDSAHFQLQSDLYTYYFDARFDADGQGLKGSLRVDTVAGPFSLAKAAGQPSEAIKSEEVSFESNGLLLKGTVWKPAQSNGHGLYFVTSSGGSDRGGSRAEAIYFARQGYTTFHFDKRGTGESEGSWESTSIETLASDDINGIRFFAEKTAIPLSRIGIKGSSQGGTKVPYILNRIKELEYGVAVSCPGSTLLESDLNYWKNSNRDNIAPEDLEQAAQLQKSAFERLAGLVAKEELRKRLAPHENAPWIEYVWIPDWEAKTDSALLFTPVPSFEQVQQPVLVVQGMSDVIIPSNSWEVIEQALAKAGNQSYSIVKIPNASHSMYDEGDSDFPYFAKLESSYLPTLSNWINRQTQ